MTTASNTSPVAPAKPHAGPDLRLPALRRFAAAISLLTLFGHTLLGFEPGWVHVVAALATSYGLEALLEVIDARIARRPYHFAGGGVQAGGAVSGVAYSPCLRALLRIFK